MSASIWAPDGAVNANSRVVGQRFVATAGQVTFNLTQFLYAPNTYSLSVYADGVFQTPYSDVVETSQSQFQIPGGVPEGTIVTAIGMVGVSSVVAVDPTAAHSGANSDITSLSGLTTALSIAQGGTNANTATGARTQLSVYSQAQVDAAIAAAVLAACPVGTMYDFAGTVVPAGFLGCDGAAVSRTTYAALFASIGTTWGAGDGSTTFNLPDSRRRVAVGSGGSGTATLANSVGSTGGAETHILTIPEMPAHTHSITTVSAQTITGGPYAAVQASGSNLTGSTGGGGAHNNMQPSMVVLKIIKH